MNEIAIYRACAHLTKFDERKGYRRVCLNCGASTWILFPITLEEQNERWYHRYTTTQVNRIFRFYFRRHGPFARQSRNA